jgi:phage terminase large subunit-like protein
MPYKIPRPKKKKAAPPFVPQLIVQTPEQVAAQKAVLKRRCQTDLYWLAKHVLGYKDMVPHVHGPMCATYVQKDPDKGIFEQSESKTSLILAARGVFKTCVHIADIVQWILCFPNIRILILTGKQDLAWRMVREVKDAFQNNAFIRDLFPELCASRDTKFGTDDEFTCPGRTEYRREPTVSSSTVASINAGGHYELIGPDDCVNEINSATPDQCQKVVDAIDDLDYLLEPGGYVQYNGTRYKPWDQYGKTLQRAAASLVEDLDPLDDKPIVDLRVCILPAWTVKEGVELSLDDNGVPIVRKSDVDLLFPERLGFRGLHKLYKKNPTKFACQMLQNPLGVSATERPFTDNLIAGHIIPFNQLPPLGVGKDFILWDLAGCHPDAEAKGSDFVVGIVGRLDLLGRLFIIDIRRGHWSALQQAAQIVTLQKDYPNAECCYIEDMQGARYLEPLIQQLASQHLIRLNIKWVKIPRVGGSKRLRIDALALVFKADRLWLASYVNHLDQLKSELLDPSPEHDDVADSIALLARELKIAAAIVIQPSAAIAAATRKAIRSAAFERALYGTGDPDVQPTVYKSGILGYGLVSN